MQDHSIEYDNIGKHCCVERGVRGNLLMQPLHTPSSLPDDTACCRTPCLTIDILADYQEKEMRASLASHSASFS